MVYKITHSIWSNYAAQSTMKRAMTTTAGKIIQTEDGKKVTVKPDIRKKGGNQVGERMTCKNSK